MAQENSRLKTRSHKVEMEAPQMPFRALFVGTSGSGKTGTLTRLILEHYPPKPLGPLRRLVWVCPSDSKTQTDIVALREAFGEEFIELDASAGFSQKLKSDIIAALKKDRKEVGNEWPADALLVLDDCMSSGGRGTFIQDLYSRSRHLGASVCELAQRIFTGDRSSRGQRLNTGYFFCFFFPSQKEVKTLLNQIEDDTKIAAAAYATYKRLSAQKYGYLLIDTTRGSSGTPARFRASSIDTPAL